MITLGDGQDGHKPPIKVHMELDNCSVPMEVDTGRLVPRPHPKNWERGLVTLASFPVCAESAYYRTHSKLHPPFCRLGLATSMGVYN